MRRTIAALLIGLATLLPANGRGQVLTAPVQAPGPMVAGLKLPADQTAAPHQLVVLKAETDGPVKFLVLGTSQVQYAVAGHTVVFVTPATGQVAVYAVAVHDGQVTDFARTIVTVTTGPPAPGPDASPAQIPPAGRLHVTVIEDVRARTPAVAAVITDAGLRKSLEALGATVRVLDVQDPLVARAQLDRAVREAGGVPVLVIQSEDGRLWPAGRASQLPATPAEVLALVKQVTGR